MIHAEEESANVNEGGSPSIHRANVDDMEMEEPDDEAAQWDNDHDVQNEWANQWN